MDFKTGDRVKVVKKYLGAVHWHPGMDKYIGKTGTIYNILYNNSVWIDFDNIKQDVMESVGQSYWFFPIQSIQKVNHQLEFDFMYD